MPSTAEFAGELAKEGIPILGCRFVGSLFEQFLFSAQPVLLLESILATTRFPITFCKTRDLLARGLRRLRLLNDFLFLCYGLVWLSGCLRLLLCNCHSNSLHCVRRKRTGHPLQGTKLLHDSDAQSGLVYLSAQQAVSGTTAVWLDFVCLARARLRMFDLIAKRDRHNGLHSCIGPGDNQLPCDSI